MTIDLAETTLYLRDGELDPDYAVPFKIVRSPYSISLSVLKKDGSTLASVLLEMAEGTIYLRAWDEYATHVGDQPSSHAILIKDAKAGFLRT